MKTTLAILALLASASMAQAGCNFYEHNNFKGKSFGVSQGCVVLSGKSKAGCGGLPATFKNGWNDIISSVQITNGSKAYLKEHQDGSGQVGVIQGTSAKAVPGINDKASVVVCRY